MAGPTSRLGYCRQLVAMAFQKFTWGRDMVIATLIAAVTAGGQLRFDLVPADKKGRFVLTVLAPYVVVLLVHILWRFIWAPWKLHREREVELQQAKDALRMRDAELQETKNQFPDIDVQIREVHFLPTPNGGNVFLLVTLHNLNGNIATKVTGYELQLEVNGRSYSGGTANIQGWYIRRDQFLGQPEALLDLAGRTQMLLQRGSPEEGWLRLFLEDGPAWPVNHITSDSYVTETGIEVRQGHGEYDLAGVTKASLLVRDAFGRTHLGSTEPPWKRTGKITLQAELPRTGIDKPPESTPSVGSSDKWQELATQFEKLPDYTRADWKCNRLKNETTFEQWQFAGGNEAKHCETLCRHAGTLLLKSPNVSLTLSANAREQSDPAWRWLYFLRENYRASQLYGHHPPIGDDGTIYLLENILGVASVSMRVCRECATLEL